VHDRKIKKVAKIKRYEGKKMKTYRDLIVWKKAINFVTIIYLKTKKFPNEERYCLVSQMRRSAVSIPSNIAEGYGRKSKKDYIRFLQIAISSIFEIQTHLEISSNLMYLPKNDFNKIFELSREIERMLSSLITKINK
jgi:four helix bundle protein